jgi:hypothetical protein
LQGKLAGKHDPHREEITWGKLRRRRRRWRRRMR